jgi:hypothetical protein
METARDGNGARWKRRGGNGARWKRRAMETARDGNGAMETAKLEWGRRHGVPVAASVRMASE